MQRTRDYYQALGFAPYRWAHFADAPFTPLAHAARAGPGRADHDRGALPAGGRRPGAGRAVQRGRQVLPGVLGPDGQRARSPHLARRLRPHAHAAEDLNTYFPLARLQDAVAAGRIGALTPRFHGAPTNRSHRVTMETDAPELLRRCREDGADAVVLVPS